MNRALLAKWWWRFGEKNEAFWWRLLLVDMMRINEAGGLSLVLVAVDWAFEL